MTGYLDRELGPKKVDFVVATARAAVAIEIRAAARFDDADLAGLRAFAARNTGVRALVLGYRGARSCRSADGCSRCRSASCCRRHGALRRAQSRRCAAPSSCRSSSSSRPPPRARRK
jgi:hypothetical protein